MGGEDVKVSCAVLAFHKIGSPPKGGWETWNYISESRFVAILEQVAGAGYEVIDQDQFLAGMLDPGCLPPRSVLLTFDDGYTSMRTVTLPILQRFGYPSVLFVPTDYVGGVNTWDLGNEPEEPICSWEDLAFLDAVGVRVQGHSASHRTFSSLRPGEQQTELTECKTKIDTALNVKTRTFAYPYGDAGSDDTSLDTALSRAGYEAAFLYKGGVTSMPPADRFRIPRVPMGPDTNLANWLEGIA